MIHSKGYAASDARSPLGPFSFDRRDPGPKDVLIDIAYCGICHSDLHQARDEWGGSIFPMVPGHEIVGHVAQVGAAVTKFRVGDTAGVGCMVDSCRTCGPCRAGLEQFCESAPTWTYNSSERATGAPTYGGYSDRIVVDEAFALRVPSSLDLRGAAPLLCAGITTWSPLRHWKVGPGQKVGVVGLGGLGHMGVKLARALGAHVVAFTTSPAKQEAALALGAHEVVLSKDEAQMRARRGSLDLVLDTVSAKHDMAALLSTLRLDGTMVLVGLPSEPISISAFALVSGRRRLSGSPIGGIAETQEMLNFCGEHAITSDVEVIAMNQVNAAYERLLRSDVRYRFVLDLKTL